jgi:lysozyme
MSLLKIIRSILAGPEFVLGCDVSTYQGVVDFNTMLAAGSKYCFIRVGYATRSGCYTDAQWNRNKVEGPKVLPCGAYWAFNPAYPAIAQADYFAANLLAGADLKLPIVVDVENDGGLTPSAVADALLVFVDRLEELTVRPVMIYTRGSWWNVEVARRSQFGLLPLWCARYNEALTGPWSDGKYRPLDWQEWCFWQFSADGNHRGREFGAESDSIDLNRYNGSYAEFCADFGINDLSLEEKVARLWAAHPELHG